jgi:hypothetical protein
MTEEQLKFIRGTNKQQFKLFPMLRNLRTKILATGGIEVNFYGKEPFLELLLEFGQIWPEEGVGFLKGKRSNCFFNSIRYVLAHEKTMSLVLGYALSEDGLWRQHGWVWNSKKERILETTVNRELYFGIGITGLGVKELFGDIDSYPEQTKGIAFQHEKNELGVCIACHGDIDD